MTEPETGVGSNQTAGNQETGGKAEGDRNPSGAGTGESPPTPSPDIALQTQLDLEKQNAAASARQEQINRQQIQAQAARIAELEKPPAPAPPQQAGEFSTLQEAASQLKTAMYADDEAGVGRALESVVSTAAKAGRDQATEQYQASQSEQQRRSQVGQYFQPYQETFNNPQDPVTARALELYGQMDQQYQTGNYMNWLPNDTIDIQVAPGVNHKVNIHLLKEAHQKAALEVASGTAPAPTTGVQPEYLEPSGRGGGEVVKGDVTNVEDLLSEDDRTAALHYFDGDTDEAKYQSYFDSFSPALKEARKKLGRPVSSTELISAGIMEK